MHAFRIHWLSTLATGWLLGGCSTADKDERGVDAAAGAERISFNTHIQPILSENCYHCHGPDAGTREPLSEPLRLDREKYAFEIREDGNPVIVKGDPEASLLVRLLKSKDMDVVMPPPKSHKQLTPAQIETIETWVAQGAEYEEHWAFIPPERPEIPVVYRADVVRNPVDAFVQEKLAEKGLSPARAEDPRVLARRAALDLTGLLPEPADVNAFAKDPTDEAYTAYLQKLFATPAYAEHRARYWLDYARYADTHGLHFDNVRSIWPYRDYVIRSFAANKRFDDFVREQVAGDLIPATTADAWIATGYIRCNVSTNEGGTIPEEIHANNTRDRAEAFGAAFLGLTVGCAACHDHKFDPTGQKDFYSLAAFFNNTAEKPWDENIAESQPVLRLPPDEKREEFDAAVARHSAAATALEARKSAAVGIFREWLAAGNKPMPVSADGLALRLRLDEGQGEWVKNSAPGAQSILYQTDTNPPVWGENVWLWPSMRMDLSTNLPIPDQGDFEQDAPFSASMWALLRMKTGNSTTGNGSLISRMGGVEEDAHRGWDLFIEGDKLVVHIVHKWPDAALRVETGGIPRGEWVHLGFSYDGSGKAEGVKLFVNGEHRSDPAISHNSLQAGQTIRNNLPLNLGRRHGSDPMRETAFQDVRLYRRALDPTEFSRLPYEDISAEILATTPDPEEWTEREKFIALDRFFLASIDGEASKLRAEILAADEQIARLGEGGTATLIARERPAPATAWVLGRGVYSERKELVSAATPEFLPGERGASTRLELAEWLFKPENPLFARVTVNRIWQEIFGIGLVSTADDFGIMGARPTNQKLLDWLAVEFRESGWNVKHIYQLLLTSSTYRQSNQVSPVALAADPANIFLSRGPRFRMDAEVLRDTALQASGLLSVKIGGPPVKPYQPEGVWEAVSMPESNTLKYKQDEGEALYRRSLYTFWKRFAPPPSLETFDAQAREVVCITRARTNTPLQALVSMNDPQFFEAARKLAERTILFSGSVPERLDYLAAKLLARPLDSREVDALTTSLKIYQSHYQANPQDAEAMLSIGASPFNTTLDPAETASWAMVANQFLNLDETLTK
jgi:mono/diheme cytochrome c family protein